VRGRVLFIIQVPPERQEDFLAAYQSVRHAVAAVDGHLVDQVCQSPTDPDQWLITSEWETIDHFLAWERSPDHRRLIGPMRACITEARSLRFVVRETTYSHGDALGDPSRRDGMPAAAGQP
jgi:heme oxygenase (mycobilin-producing)